MGPVKWIPQCGVLEYDRTIPDKRQKPEDVSGVPAVRAALHRVLKKR